MPYSNTKAVSKLSRFEQGLCVTTPALGPRAWKLDGAREVRDGYGNKRLSNPPRGMREP